MSAIDDLDRAKQNTYGGVWSWEPHGDGWALYVNRGEPIFPELPRGICNVQHGYNILTVNRSGFDRHGEDLRTFILEAGMKVPLLAEERDAERKAWARFLKAWRAEMCAKRDGGGLDDWHAEQADTEHDAAKQALRDLGVDVDALLGEP
jgi:hypothetical protein